jgi:hypothetical protein
MQMSSSVGEGGGWFIFISFSNWFFKNIVDIAVWN